MNFQKKMHILIVELDYHKDILSFFLELIDLDLFNVSCIVNKNIYPYLSDDLKSKLNFYIYLNKYSLKKFLNRTKCDLTIFNTCASKFYFWSKYCPSNSVMRIHNINAYFIPLKSIRIRFNFFEIRKAITYILFHQTFCLSHLFLKKLLTKINLYLFMSDANKKYFLSIQPDHYLKAGPVLPIAAYNSKYFKELDIQNISIVIPGYVESKRKDFYAIWECCKSLSNLKIKTELVLAGKTPTHSLKFIKQIKSLENSNFRII